METFGKRSQMILANLSEVRGQLDRGCELQKSDGGFRMIDWMVSLGALYRNCLANVRKVEQNGENLDSPPHISAYKPVGILSFFLCRLVVALSPGDAYFYTFFPRPTFSRDYSLEARTKQTP